MKKRKNKIGKTFIDEITHVDVKIKQKVFCSKYTNGNFKVIFRIFFSLPRFQVFQPQKKRRCGIEEVQEKKMRFVLRRDRRTKCDLWHELVVPQFSHKIPDANEIVKRFYCTIEKSAWFLWH